MKLIVVLGSILFASGAAMVIWNGLNIPRNDLPIGVVFIAILLMIIPVVALASWVIWKVIKNYRNCYQLQPKRTVFGTGFIKPALFVMLIGYLLLVVLL